MNINELEKLDTISQCRLGVKGVSELLYALSEQPNDIDYSALVVLAKVLDSVAERLG